MDRCRQRHHGKGTKWEWRRGGAASGSKDQSGNNEMALGEGDMPKPGFQHGRNRIGRIGWESKVSIEICSACRPLNGVDRAVMILIEFLKMVVQNIAYLRVQTSPLAMAPTWIIPLRAFQYAMVGEIGFRSDRRLWPLLLTPFQATMGLTPCLIRWLLGRFHCQALFYVPLRLAPRLCT